MPEGPAVAARRALQLRAERMNRSGGGAAQQRTVGADMRGKRALAVEQFDAGCEQAVFDQCPERHPHLRFDALHRGQRAFVERQRRSDPFVGDRDIILLALDPDPFAPETLGHRPGGPGAEERIEHHVALVGGRQHHPIEQRLGLLGRVRLGPVALDPLGPATDRQDPVGAHLEFVVERLHRPVVEGVARLLAGRGPDQGLVGVGEAGALEIGHRVGLAPDDVVEDPEPQVLEDRADPEDVVIAADHPQRTVRLEDALGFGQPGAGEIVISLKTGELVPRVVDRIHAAAVGTVEIAAELEVVGRIREHAVDAGCWQPPHRFDAIAFENPPKRQRGLPQGRPHRNAPAHDNARLQ